MDGFKQHSNQLPAHRLPRPDADELIDFDFLALPDTTRESDASAPFGAYLAKLSALPESLISRFLNTADTAALAVLCRAIGLTRDAFEVLTLCCAPTLGPLSLAPASALFDALSRARAERIVAQWRLCKPDGDGPARFPILAPHRDA